MAVKLISQEWCPCVNASRKEFICDTDADFESLPEACPGSKAISLWSKKERVVNTKGRWVPYGEYFVGAPILDLVTVESEGGSGTIEVGKTYTFKNDLTKETLANFATDEAVDTEMGVGVYKIAYDANAGLMYMYDVADGYVYFIDMSGGGAAQYVYMFETSELNGIPAPKGWGLVSDADRTITSVEPPEYTVPENPDTTFTMEELSVLFDGVGGGSKTMLSVTDTNDEGIVASYEVYADDALVDTVPKAETIDATALGVTAGASVTVKAKSIIDTTSEASNAVIFA